MSNILLYLACMFFVAPPYWGAHIAANPAGKRFMPFILSYMEDIEG